MTSKLIDMNDKEKGELLRYGISGALIAIINWLSYALLTFLGIDYKISNIIAIVLSKTSGYFLNKIYVYKSKTNRIRDTVVEMLRFATVRVFTGVVDYLGVIFFVEVVNMNNYFSKIVVTAFVITFNYLLGKVFVFNR